MRKSSSRVIALAILAAGAIVGIAILFTDKENVGLFKSPDPFRVVKIEVSKGLIDPGSAQFKKLRDSHGIFFCGEVNAKNRMGGYVGFKIFYAQKGSDGEFLVTFDEKLVKAMCD